MLRRIRRSRHRPVFLAVAFLCLAPTASYAQNVTAHEVNAPAELVGGQTATFELIVERAPSTPNFSGELVFVRGGQMSTAIPLNGFGPQTIPEGGLHSVMVSALVPNNVEGLYQVGVRLDPANVIDEVNELDNFAAATDYTRVRARAPNGVAMDIAASASEALVGSSLDVDVTVDNTGELAGTFDASVRLSRDDVVTSADLEIGRMSVAVAAGASRTITINTTIPPSLAARAYTLGFVVDPDGSVVESNETDNTFGNGTPFVVYWDSLTLESATVPAATLTVAYDMRLVSTGGDGTYQYTVTGGALPDGVTLATTGRLSGVPTRTGSFDFDITVRSRGMMDVRSYSVVVATTNAPVRIATREAWPGFKDLQYEQILVAGGGEGPYIWTVESGTLPDGLDLTTAGVISGIPRSIGMFTVEVGVEDFRGDRDQVELTIQVVFASQVLVLSSDLAPLALGVEVGVPLMAIGGRPPYEWTALTRAPPGLTLTEDGVLTGTPIEVGEFKMRVRAQDSKSTPATDSTLVTINVESQGDFRIVQDSLPPAIVRAPYEVIIEAEGGTPPLSWRVAPGTSLPDGFFAVEGDGERAPIGTLRVYGIGFRAAVQPFILRVEDAAGRRREVAYALSVQVGGGSGDGGDGGCVCVTSRPSWPSLLVLVGLFAIGRRRR